MIYKFENIENCEMCHSEVSSHIKLGQRLNRSQGLFAKSKKGVSVSIYRCSNCGLHYSNPMPIPFNILDHYGVPPKDYWTPEYFEQIPNVDSLVKEASVYIDIDSRPKLLDVGAGIGKSMAAFSRHGFDVYGIEPSPNFVEMAIESMKIDREKLLCQTIEDAKFPDNFFDYVTFGAVFEHVYHPSMVLEQVLKWVKPGGLVKIQVPSSNWLTSKVFNLWYKLSFQDYCTNLSPMHTPYHLYEFSLESFRKNAELNGYEIVGSHYEICSTFLPKILDFILKPFMRWTNTGMEIYVLLKKV
jgi:SAM-dependent methyltransferase